MARRLRWTRLRDREPALSRTYRGRGPATASTMAGGSTRGRRRRQWAGRERRRGGRLRTWCLRMAPSPDWPRRWWKAAASGATCATPWVCCSAATPAKWPSTSASPWRASVRRSVRHRSSSSASSPTRCRRWRSPCVRRGNGSCRGSPAKACPPWMRVCRVTRCNAAWPRGCRRWPPISSRAIAGPVEPRVTFATVIFSQPQTLDVGQSQGMLSRSVLAPWAASAATLGVVQ